MILLEKDKGYSGRVSTTPLSCLFIAFVGIVCYGNIYFTIFYLQIEKPYSQLSTILHFRIV